MSMEVKYYNNSTEQLVYNSVTFIIFLFILFFTQYIYIEHSFMVTWLKAYYLAVLFHLQFAFPVESFTTQILDLKKTIFLQKPKGFLNKNQPVKCIPWKAP